MKINSVLYIFDKLKKLEIPKNSFVEISGDFEKRNENNPNEVEKAKIKNPYLNEKKGHLIYLFPLFTKCIMTKEQDVKNQLKEIFDDISEEMDLKKYYD